MTDEIAWPEENAGQWGSEFVANTKSDCPRLCVRV